jgi:preprotein translocase subunit SecE
MVAFTINLFNRKEIFVVAFNPLTYLKQSKEELDKVVWPTRTETLRLTIVVLAVSVIIGLYISGLDALLTKITEEFLR